MHILALFLVGLVAVAHFGFLVLEMFLWQKPVGLKVFRQSPENAARTAVLAKNQGLYNGFLAAGLLWGAYAAASGGGAAIATFFLRCVAIAGTYGAVTVSRGIFFVQALPALFALAAVWIAG
jgi:putative membrane protein